MRRSLLVFAAASLGLLCGAGTPARAADTYAVDDNHTAVVFKVSHLGISWTFGRFNDVAGSFTLDPADPAKSSFALAIKAASLDTNNAKRDEHLRSPDFFNVKQYPEITFKSTAVRPVEGGYEVTGEFTLHGQTRPLTFALKGGKAAEFPKGVQRVGFTTDLAVKRSEFGMDKLVGPVGDEVYIAISFEGVKK